MCFSVAIICVPCDSQDFKILKTKKTFRNVIDESLLYPRGGGGGGVAVDM